MTVKKAFTLFIVNTVLILIFVITIEVTVRVAFPNINLLGNSKDLFEDKKFGDSYGLRPCSTGYSFGVKIITDSSGFRTIPISIDSNKNYHSILLLGDSVFFGVGVKATDTLHFFLQRYLKNYQIINASVIGYNVHNYFNVLKTLLTKLDFEGVIIGITFNDFNSFSQIALSDFSINSFTMPSLNYFLIQHSKAYILIRSLFCDISKSCFEMDSSVYNNPKIINSIPIKLKEINNLAVKNGKWVIFFILPYEYQLRQNFANDFMKPQIIINKVALEEKLPIVDLYPFFRSNITMFHFKSKELYLFEDPMHFSVIGHKIAAEAIYNELKQRNVLLSQ